MYRSKELNSNSSRRLQDRRFCTGEEMNVYLGQPTKDGGATLTREEVAWLRSLLGNLQTSYAVSHVAERMIEQEPDFLTHARRQVSDLVLHEVAKTEAVQVGWRDPESDEDAARLRAQGCRLMRAEVTVLRKRPGPPPFHPAERTLVLAGNGIPSEQEAIVQPAIMFRL